MENEILETQLQNTFRLPASPATLSAASTIDNSATRVFGLMRIVSADQIIGMVKPDHKPGLAEAMPDFTALVLLRMKM